ncbi:MAG: hypothetical protein F6K31_07320 [Symploca sp. SIO2G7]|nr:hypothetical protein [Symploca sp. SIO2G7]
MMQIGVQVDPLNSPHPVPWSWVLATHAEVSTNEHVSVRYYRSHSLISPDGQYATYSRIQIKGEPELHRSRITSVMFVENLQTGDLRTITASSPLADNPLTSSEETDLPGAFSIVLPISWSNSSDRVLARQFEGLLGTSNASDYAVVWDCQQHYLSTIAPEGIDYTYAVLLGWSQNKPEQVLFRTGELGNENWSMWSVTLNGKTTLAVEEKPMVFGQVINHVWAGPQVSLRGIKN